VLKKIRLPRVDQPDAPASDSYCISAHSVGAEEACAQADVIVTATTARADGAPLFEAGWVRPGTHISCMGADSPGKRELRPNCSPGQASSAIFRSGPAPGRKPARTQGHGAHSLGMVLAGRAAGRGSDSDITIFDSSGIGVQTSTWAWPFSRNGSSPVNTTPSPSARHWQTPAPVRGRRRAQGPAQHERLAARADRLGVSLRPHVRRPRASTSPP